MNDLDLDEALTATHAIAREAGLLTLAGYRTGVDVTYKGEVDPVTEVDLASEELIRRRLAQRFPGTGVLAEESGEHLAADSRARWLVDPLDGTVNYSHGHPFYSVSIALEIDGILSVAVVHAPVLGLTWTARRGGGAFRNGARACVSERPTLNTSLVASGFPYDRRTSPSNNLAEWSAVKLRVQGGRRCGCASIDLAFVADGTYEGYWEKKLGPWDMAAGVLLVEEAGGRAEGLDGAPIPPWPQTLVATNGLVHDELTELLRRVARTGVDETSSPA